ncbi:MAG: hemerythrin domain-containing protein [Candidatus Eisenbacteria bacterium]
MGTKASAHAGPSAFFTADHRECDALWAELEAICGDGKADAVESAWMRFDRAMRRHFAMEEEVLFPALEEATGMPRGAGPIAVMRMEHDQMKGMLGQMADARGDGRELLDLGDTLLMLIQQHNTKEEGILYPMADDALAAGWSELATQLDRY